MLIFALAYADVKLDVVNLCQLKVGIVVWKMSQELKKGKRKQMKKEKPSQKEENLEEKAKESSKESAKLYVT